MAHGSIFRRLLASVLLACPLWSSFQITEIQPYLLPADHPIKPLLDSLFTASRATFHLKSLEKAGFRKSQPRKFTKLIVTSHPAIPGYIFKLYLDAQRFHKDLPEYHFWILRCQGARKIQEVIDQNNLSSLCKVPQKWIYLLPTTPFPPQGYFPKMTLLVEEDMDIFPNKENKALWASGAVTPEMLEALFQILKEVGLHDCVKPDNIPFSRDGRIAFIDTQTFDSRVHYKELTHFLSKPNRLVWKAIIRDSE